VAFNKIALSRLKHLDNPFEILQVTGDSEPKELDKDLLKQIFKAYGETDLMDDDALHEEMIKAAIPTGGTDMKLDLATFAAALSYDIQDYDLKNEIRNTTNYDDIMLTHAGHEFVKGHEIELSRELTLADVESRRSKAASLSKSFTAPAIDSTAGTYRSKYLITLLYVAGKSPKGSLCVSTGLFLNMIALLLLRCRYTSVTISWFQDWFDQISPTGGSSCQEYVYKDSNSWSVNAGVILCETGMSILGWLLKFLYFR
jgi:hypothetical protein